MGVSRVLLRGLVLENGADLSVMVRAWKAATVITRREY